MRRSRQLILTLLVTATLIGLSWFAGQNRDKERLQPACLLIEPLAAGSLLEPNQFKEIWLQEADLPRNAVTMQDLPTPCYARTDLLAGDLLIRDRISPWPSGLVYSNSGPGRRLMTLELDPAQANGFWLSAGNLIDLYLIPRNPGLDSVQVLRALAVQSVMRPQSTDLHATDLHTTLLCLDLSSEQADQLALALDSCFIRLSVVNEEALIP